jgi:Protein of unknown function (DUF3987)
MSNAKSAANGRHANHLDDVASAAVLCKAEQTRQAPDKEARSRLDPDWSDGIGMAVEDGRSGTDRWLKALKARSPARHAPIVAAIKVAREAPAPGNSGEDDEPIAGQVGVPWQEPMLGGMPPAAPFPVDIFPPQLQDLAVEMAEALNSPIDFVAISILFTASTAMGRSVALELKKTWKEYPSAYFALVGVSGMAKTTPIKEMARPLWAIGKEMREEWQAHKEREGKKDKDKQEDVPPLKRTIVDDSTVEALAQIMNDNPRGNGQIRDELTALVAGMNQYKGGKGSDRQFYLSVDSGVSQSIDRVKNPDGMPLVIHNPFLSIIGGLVNSKLASLSDAKERDDGFIERLLFTVPDPVRVRWRDEEVDEDLIENWDQAVRRLWGTPMVDSGESPRPYFVVLDPAAKSAFKSWFNAHSEETEGLDFPDYLGGAWSKMRAKCARLALIIDRLHWAYDPTSDEKPGNVSLASVRAAIRLIDYFKAHARRAHALIRGCGGDDNENARAILKWVSNTNRSVFSEKDVKNNFAGRFPDEMELEKATTWLLARRCIRRLPTPARGKHGGRTPSPRYEVDPSLLPPSASTHAEPEEAGNAAG